MPLTLARPHKYAAHATKTNTNIAPFLKLAVDLSLNIKMEKMSQRVSYILKNS